MTNAISNDNSKLLKRCKKKCHANMLNSKRFCKKCLNLEMINENKTSNKNKINDKLVHGNKNFPGVNENEIVNVGNAKFYVPNYPVDAIQRIIVDDRTFYEINILLELQSYINKNAIILDIGANIGNHSIYWALKAFPKGIYSFEPVPDTFKILKTNIEINDLTDKVKIYNLGLSNRKINGTISFYIPWNIGATQIKQNSNGSLRLDKLDNIEIDEKTIDFMKIDVEGHELEVLQGATKTLQTYRPTIFIEIFECNKMKVNEFLINLGYRLEKEFPSSNYLYIFNNGE